MTMPHLMNCSHSCDGWCLECVKDMQNKYELSIVNEKQKLLQRYKALFDLLQTMIKDLERS